MKKSLIIAGLAIIACACQPKLKLGQPNRIVDIETEYGVMKVRLYDETPIHRDNFVKLSNEHYFDGTLFHRVIDGFMIQGGDPDSKGAKEGQRLGEGGPGYRLPAEFREGIYHKRGVIAAAREGDQVNPEKKSAGSQFYIAQGKVYTKEELMQMVEKRNQRLKSSIFQELQKENTDSLIKFQTNAEMDKMTALIDQIKLDVDSIFEQKKMKLTDEQVELYTTIGGIPHLDGNYTVFGEVIEGLNIIDSIAKVDRDQFDRPLKDVKMTIKLVK